MRVRNSAHHKLFTPSNVHLIKSDNMDLTSGSGCAGYPSFFWSFSPDLRECVGPVPRPDGQSSDNLFKGLSRPSLLHAEPGAQGVNSAHGSAANILSCILSTYSELTQGIIIAFRVSDSFQSSSIHKWCTNTSTKLYPHPLR